MTGAEAPRRIPIDSAFIWLLLAVALFAGYEGWLATHPQYDPWAPLALDDPPGWATSRKLAALRSKPGQCRAVLRRSEVAFEPRDPAGDGPCLRSDRVVLTDFPAAPQTPVTTCPVAAALHRWLTQGVQPAAQAQFGVSVMRIHHLGAYNCRRLYGRANGRWSEHATGNAIDIAGFVLTDGTEISLLRDWDGDTRKATFLRDVRDAACESFGTVLSPDYNAQHADHFHLDQMARGLGSACR